ncbi:MAG: hypothetical protein ACREVY_02040 [Gammaproteobacteria bacterium]
MIGPELYSFRALWRHYRNCRRNKRNTFNALAFEADAEAKLLALQEDLRAHSYRPGRSICFITDGPKPREVFAADFRDRVVHHLLVSHQERIFEPLFIHDSYACRKNKGTLAASDRLMAFLRRVTDGRRRAWALRERPLGKPFGDRRRVRHGDPVFSASVTLGFGSAGRQIMRRACL